MEAQEKYLDDQSASEQLTFYCDCMVEKTEANDYWSANPLFKCRACGLVIDIRKPRKGDDEDEGRHFTMRTTFVPTFYYLGLCLVCKCGNHMELFQGLLPKTDEHARTPLQSGSPLELPSETWSIVFGCARCGHVALYRAAQVTGYSIPKDQEGQYQSGKGVFCATFPCANRDCKLPVSIHVDTCEMNARETLDLIRTGLFDGRLAQCGHRIATVPRDRYRIEPVTRRMW